MAAIKTKATKVSVADFLESKAEGERLADCKTLVKMMKAATGAPAKMWGPTIVGFGQYHYEYASGHSGDMCAIGFSPRKPEIVLYFGNFPGREALQKKLGKHRTGKSCVYIRKLADIDLKVLEEMIDKSVKLVAKQRTDT